MNPSAAPSHRTLALILGALAGMGPFSVDMYLPAFPALGASLGATPGAVQATLAVYFLGMAVGQVFYGPVADRFGRRGPLVRGARAVHRGVAAVRAGAGHQRG